MPSLQHHGVGLVLRALRVRAPFQSAEAMRASLGSPSRLGAAPTPLAKLRSEFRCELGTFPAGTLPEPTAWPVWEFTPRTFLPSTTILYFHGGAYVREAVSPHWVLVEQLLRDVPARVVFPRYALAPGTSGGGAGGQDPESAPTPTSAQVTVTTAAALIAEWTRMLGSQEVVVMGDSAGAGLALAAVQHLRDQGSPELPRELVLISPWLDLTMSDPEQAGLERGDPLLARPGLAEAGRIYAGELGTEHPFASPLFGSMADLPPMIVLSSTGDLLLPDSRRLVAAARAAGVEVSYDEQPGLFHDFALLPVPEGARARDLVVAACRT